MHAANVALYQIQQHGNLTATFVVFWKKNEGRGLACCIITFAAYLVSKIHKAIFVAAANDFSNKFLSISCLVTLKFKTFAFVTWLFLF